MKREVKANIVATIGLIYIILMFVEGSVFNSVYLLMFLFVLLVVLTLGAIWLMFRQLYFNLTE